MFGALLLNSIVARLLLKLEQFHQAIQDPFVYLLRFIVETQTMQHILRTLGAPESKIYSDLSHQSDLSLDFSMKQYYNYAKISSFPLVAKILIDHEYPINIPIELHEPLTMLQRLTEIFEFSSLLDSAATSKNIAQQLTYLATFSNLSFSTVYERISMPFTPLLGETFECDKVQEFGWRCISEQVQHLPSVCVMFCEASGWVCRQEFTYDLSAEKEFISIFSKGYLKVYFTESGCEYVWKRVRF
ncbi:unnamed protein product [Hermetia illucens]|uniref:Uncharacterized protein n=1 Tax=Hermetia illucens TaxID=343691 RepID=A0A7R8UV97_HERIL|nr:unnamed protein product [Hermetia illucens]